MKLACDLIEDLLPLYAEDMVSEVTKKAVEEHLAECGGCREALRRMEKGDVGSNTAQKNDLKHFRKKMLTLVLGAIGVEFCAMYFFFSFMIIGSPFVSVASSTLVWLPLAAFLGGWKTGVGKVRHILLYLLGFTVLALGILLAIGIAVHAPLTPVIYVVGLAYGFLPFILGFGIRRVQLRFPRKDIDS